MSQSVQEVNGEELQKLIESNRTVVCDFWAAWCGPCRMLAPVMETMAQEFQDRAVFVKINVDENGETAAAYSVMSIPDVIVFENGKVKTDSLGYVPEEQMRTFLRQNL